MRNAGYIKTFGVLALCFMGVFYFIKDGKVEDVMKEAVIDKIEEEVEEKVEDVKTEVKDKVDSEIKKKLDGFKGLFKSK